MQALVLKSNSLKNRYLIKVINLNFNFVDINKNNDFKSACILKRIDTNDASGEKFKSRENYL